MNHGIRTILYPVKTRGAQRAFSANCWAASLMLTCLIMSALDLANRRSACFPTGTSREGAGRSGISFVDDIKKSLQALVNEGAEIQQPVTDVGAGRLVAAVKDADGNLIGLLQTA